MNDRQHKKTSFLADASISYLVIVLLLILAATDIILTHHIEQTVAFCGFTFGWAILFLDDLEECIKKPNKKLAIGSVICNDVLILYIVFINMSFIKGCPAMWLLLSVAALGLILDIILTIKCVKSTLLLSVDAKERG